MLVTAKMLGYNSLAIGKLIKLNDSNKAIINSFLNSFGSLSPIKVNTKMIFLNTFIKHNNLLLISNVRLKAKYQFDIGYNKF